MSRVDEALREIDRLRAAATHGTVCRGLRSAAVAATAGVALAGGLTQHVVAPQPWRTAAGGGGGGGGRLDPAYLAVWLSVAAVAAAVIGIAMAVSVRRNGRASQRAVTRRLVEAVLPPLAAGMCLTLAVTRWAPGSAWLLPGLWSVSVAIAAAATRPVLPRWVTLVTAWYLAAGLGCVALGPARALQAWVMPAVFGTGQTLAATVLFLSLERGANHAAQT